MNDLLRWAMGLTNWLVTGVITCYNPLYTNYNPFTQADQEIEYEKKLAHR
jgi:hypothetical protein